MESSTFSIFNATGGIAAAVCLLVFLFTMIYIIFNDINLIPSSTNNVKSQQQSLSNILIALCVTLLVSGIAIRVASTQMGLEQISNVMYFLLFTIGTIMFYAFMPSNVLNNYAYMFNPLILVVGAVAFMASATSSYAQQYRNMSYERIKAMVMLFCMFALIITFYNINPGNAAHKYFGYPMILTIVLTVFALVYVIVLATMRAEDGGQPSPNLLPAASSAGMYSLMFLAIFLAIAGAVMYSDKTFFEDKIKASSIIIVLLVVSVVWCTAVGFYAFDDLGQLVENAPKVDLFKKALLFLLGIVMFAIFVSWLVYNIEGLSSKMGVTHFVLNFLLMAMIVWLLYNTVVVKQGEKGPLMKFVGNFFFLLQCILGGVFEVLTKLVEYIKCIVEENADPFIVLATIIGFLVVYFTVPGLANFVTIQGGKLLVNQPVYTDTPYVLGNYQQLTGRDTFDYEFAISCWVFLDAMPPNTNANYNQFTSLLNFGNKPNILYNASANELKVTMQQKDLKNLTHNTLLDFDHEDNRILFVQKDFLLQKWNNIIVNYNSGTLDIFLNGELVKSSIEVVPYHTFENLTIGEVNGIKGGICNVVYFSKALTASNVYYIYNTLKSKTPPVLNDSTETVIYNI